jgi:predicted MPP superfamily phosphohydrolase
VNQAEIRVAQSNYGGVVEYLALALLVFQIVLVRRWLKRRRAVWPRSLWLAATAGLIAIWVVTAAAIYLAWTGSIYDAREIPVELRTSVLAAGYLWILLSSLATAICYLGKRLADRLPGEHSRSRRNLLRTAGLIAIAAPASAVAYGTFVERHQYGVAELDFPIPNLHPDFDGYRVVQVSDLHVSPFLSPRDARRAIDMANELRADLALFTGDLISEPGDPLNDAIRELIRLKGNEGVLGCMGNHEGYVGCRNYLQREGAKAGMVFLRDSATQIRRGQGVLNIAGVDYQKTSDRPHYLPGVQRHVIPGMANLLLSHNPDVFPAAVERGFQAVLGGHTHGGQISVEILHQNVTPARFRTPFISGLYRQARPDGPPASCYVTNGIGTIGMPIRLGAPPEIALLRLRRA